MSAKLEEDFKNLKTWADSLPAIVLDAERQILDLMKNGMKSADCPSKAHMAEVIFRQVAGVVDEIVAGQNRVYKELWEEPQLKGK